MQTFLLSHLFSAKPHYQNHFIHGMKVRLVVGLLPFGIVLVKCWHPGHLQLSPVESASERCDLTHFFIQCMWKTW